MEFTSKNLTFIIVTFNSKKVIFNCLNSLPKDFHKIIIENSSDQELKKELEQNYVNTRVILSSNIGMGAGNNLGINKSNTKYVYILNPDVFLKHNTIQNINNSISKLENFVLVLTPEGGTYAVSQFRSGFYYIAKDMNIPYVPIEIDFKNRSFNIQEPHFVEGTFEEESLKLEKLFEGVEGATRTFTMLREKE